MTVIYHTSMSIKYFQSFCSPFGYYRDYTVTTGYNGASVRNDILIEGHPDEDLVLY